MNTEIDTPSIRCRYCPMNFNRDSQDYYWHLKVHNAEKEAEYQECQHDFFHKKFKEDKTD